MHSSISLKAKLLLLIGGVSLVALALFGVMAYQSKNALSSGKHFLAQNAADSWSRQLQGDLAQKKSDVLAFSASEAARSGEASRIKPFMLEMIRTYAPAYSFMMMADAKGKVIAAMAIDKDGKPVGAEGLLGHDVSGEGWFKAAAADISNPRASIQDLSVDAELAQLLSNDGKVVGFSAPILDKMGQLLGVWCNRASAETLIGSYANLQIENFKAQHSAAVAALVDAKGQYLWRSEDKIYGETFKSVSSLPAAVGLNWQIQLELPVADPHLSFNNYLTLFIAIAMSIGVLVGFVFVNKISKTFNSIISHLNQESTQTLSASGSITSASHRLAQATTEQASALQETASAIEQMNAMVKKSADGATRSREVATTSHQVANKGKQSVDEMVHAIEDINSSNGMIMREVEEGNKQISEIVKLINEIGNKTKVIDDIVFQTKLLSFNASVEAARAGEHGKGFAVVAEEVGNLAQMSGNASKEIAEMLNGSIAKVEGIVSSSKEKVARLIEEGRQKVESGTQIAQTCGEVLEQVVKNVSELTLMVGEITTATHEQALGINEITKAMNQLDQTTHENAAISQEAATAADMLDGQAHSLKFLIGRLRDVVDGGEETVALPAKAARSVEKITIPEAPAPIVKEKATVATPKKVVDLKTVRPALKNKNATALAKAPAAAAPAQKTRATSVAVAAPSKILKTSKNKVTSLKKVTGSDILPSENDPRFKDI